MPSPISFVLLLQMRYPSYIARRLQECLDLSPLRHSGMIEDDETVVTWSTLTAGGSAHGETEGIAAGPVAEEVEPVVGEEKTMSKPTEEIAVNIGQTSKYSIESNQRYSYKSSTITAFI